MQRTPIVLTCASGQRGGMGLVVLNLLGNPNVRNLAGGDGEAESSGGWGIPRLRPAKGGWPASRNDSREINFRSVNGPELVDMREEIIISGGHE